MDFSEYLRALKRSWAVVLVATLLGGIIGFGYARSSPPLYKASSSVFVSAQQGTTTSELVQGSTYTQNLIQSYAQLATLPMVLEPVIARLRLDTTAADLGRSVSAVSPLNTVLIEISVVDSSPAEAARIANAVSDSLANTVQGISPKTAAGTPAVTMQQVAQATEPAFAFAPNTRLLTLTGALLGLALAVIFAVGRELLDTRIKVVKDLHRVTDQPLLGTIPWRRRTDPAGIALRVAPQGQAAESYRRLAANLEYINPDDPVRSVVVTSASEGEGKSLTAINLALALREKFPRVLLVDADLRQPRVAKYCQIEGGVGLSNVLAGAAELGAVIEPWGGIHVLPSGTVPPNPNQLISSETMLALLRTCTADFDIVVIDSAPLLPVADSLVLSRISDGAVFVARSGRTKRAHLAAALEAVAGVNGRVVGVVLNGLKTPRKDQAYGYGIGILRETPEAEDQISKRPEHRSDEVSVEDNTTNPAAVRAAS